MPPRPAPHLCGAAYTFVMVLSLFCLTAQPSRAWCWLNIIIYNNNNAPGSARRALWVFVRVEECERTMLGVRTRGKGGGRLGAK